MRFKLARFKLVSPAPWSIGSPRSTARATAASDAAASGNVAAVACTARVRSKPDVCEATASSGLSFEPVVPPTR